MRLLATARAFSLSLLAGAAAGAIVGVAARAAMTVSAWTAGASRQGLLTAERAIVGDATLEGTISVVAIGVLVGIAGGALHALLRPLLPPRHRGLAFGAAALLLAGWTILDPANSDFHRFGWPPLNYAMFGALFLLYGAALTRAETWLDARAPDGPWSAALWAPIALAGGAIAAMNAVFGTDRHPRWALIALAAIGAAYGARWLVLRSYYGAAPGETGSSELSGSSEST